MGAYYEGCIYNKQKNRWARIKNRYGLKLLEHSYLDNFYVDDVIRECGAKGTNLIWLCDYHDGKVTWENTIELFNSIPEQEKASNKFKYILNKTKKMFIDINGLKKIHEYIEEHLDIEEDYKGWHIHPIPILCNSDKDYQGGGDYRIRDMRRASWSGDIIAYSQNYPRNYKDVTYDVVFREEDEMNLLFDLLDGEENEY